MSESLIITNHGPLIESSNFWATEPASHGFYYLSINAGCFRLLVPESQRRAISDMRPGAKYVVVSMLHQDKWAPRQYVVEWMVEDGSETPWRCHLSQEQVDRVPGRDDVGKQWTASVWDLKKGVPHKCFERPAYYQIVPHLPWMKKIEQGI